MNQNNPATPEAIAAAREIHSQPSETDEGLYRIHGPFRYQKMLEERTASIIQKHYASKDAEIMQLKNKSLSHELDFNELKQERDELKARVAELERAIKEYADRVDKLLNHCPIDECGKCAEIVCPYGESLHLHHDGCPACSNPNRKLDTYFDIMSATPSDSLTRLQELERKAKALDWYDRNSYKVDMSQVGNDQGWTLLNAIESAMEKQA